MATLKEQLQEAVGQTGNSIGELAGMLRERMFAANAAGESEKAKAADALFQDYTFFAMKLGRVKIAAIDESAEMKTAIQSLKNVIRSLKDEAKRVANLKNKIDSAVNLLAQVENGIDEVSKLTKKSDDKQA